MEEKGLQEDPRYSQLLALRARQGNMDPNQRPPPPMQVSSIYYNLLFYLLNYMFIIKYFNFRVIILHNIQINHLRLNKVLQIQMDPCHKTI